MPVGRSGMGWFQFRRSRRGKSNHFAAISAGGKMCQGEVALCAAQPVLRKGGQNVGIGMISSASLCRQARADELGKFSQNRVSISER